MSISFSGRLERPELYAATAGRGIILGAHFLVETPKEEGGVGTKDKLLILFYLFACLFILYLFYFLLGNVLI